MKICLIKLGNIVEGFIEVVTLGRGKDIATWVARKLGYKDCGCDRRKEYLNSLLGCPQKAIKLKKK
jgi:hypothetical protein